MSLTTAPTLSVAGRNAPASSPERPLSTSPASGRPWQLNDRDWLARRYLEAGDNAIATELGVSPGSVIRARKRLRIASQPAGRRRGIPTMQPVHSSAAQLITDRIGEEARPDGPAPSLQLLGGRFVALVEADRAGERAAVKDALIALGSACGLVLDHLHRLEAA